jgi:hypothetical protein
MPVTPELLADYVMLLARTLPEYAVAATLIAAGVVGLLIGVLGRVLELKEQRAAEAIAVQGEIADALLRDPALLGLPLTPMARVPLWRGSPVTVKVAGKVPSHELRAIALRAAERGAAELLVRVRIKSRIGVVRSKTRHSRTAERTDVGAAGARGRGRGEWWSASPSPGRRGGTGRPSGGGRHARAPTIAGDGPGSTGSSGSSAHPSSGG